MTFSGEKVVYIFFRTGGQVTVPSASKWFSKYLKWYSCQFLLVVGVDEFLHVCSAMRQEWHCVVPCLDVAAADHRCLDGVLMDVAEQGNEV